MKLYFFVKLIDQILILGIKDVWGCKLYPIRLSIWSFPWVLPYPVHQRWRMCPLDFAEKPTGGLGWAAEIIKYGDEWNSWKTGETGFCNFTKFLVKFPIFSKFYQFVSNFKFVPKNMPF